jgi:carbonic anhydrase
MENLQRLFDTNRAIVAEITEKDPDFFRERAGKQEPHFLFIGCSDSRVPIETLTGAAPGEMFVHRNIANQVRSADMNLLSVLQYAVEVLDVEHVIVCGHYQCGGVKAAMGSQSYGLDHHTHAGIRDTSRLARQPTRTALPARGRAQRAAAGLQPARTPIVQSAWKRGRRPKIHGIVYDIHDGLLKELVLKVDGNEVVETLLETGRRSIGD